jgi:Cu2+-exporting ATPase
VYDVLHREGLDHFYDLRGDKNLPPVPPQAMRARDDAWLKAIVDRAEGDAEDGGEVSAVMSVQGLSCVGCVWLMERLFSRHEGGVRLDVDVVRGELKVAWRKGLFDLTAFAAELQGFGYLAGPPRLKGDQPSVSRALERRMGLCGAFAMNAMAFSLPRYFGMPTDFAFASLFELVTIVSATLALLVGGSYFMDRAWRSLRSGVLHIDTPIAIGLLVAYVGSLGGWLAKVEELKYFDFVGTFTFLMLAGRWAQQASVERNRRKLMRDTSIPDSVEVKGAGGQWQPSPLAELESGMRFRVPGGQTVPVACRLDGEEGVVSLEWINGESESLARERGQLLPSGALNIGSQTVEAVALETWEVSTLHRLLESKKQGEVRDQGLERILRWYLGSVLVIAIVGGTGWWLSGAELAKSLQVMISILVVSCPCALGVAIPLADELAASRAERMGVFVRKLGFWRRLNRVRRVVFDKTGTLTLENPVLVDESPLQGLEPQARAALRTLVAGNLHPVSRSVFDALGPGSILEEPETVEEIGKGTRLVAGDGSVWALGRPGWMAQGDGDVVFSEDGQTLATLSFREALRSESVAECRRLGEAGLEVHILSGDREAKVQDIAERLGLESSHWQSGMTPESKASWLQDRDHTSLFVGDGANDSLAFDAALCSGSPVSGRSFLEQKADFFFMGHSLRFVSSLIDVARSHRRATHWAFGFAVSYNAAAVSVGLAGGLNPLLAAILMPASSVITLGLVGLAFAGRDRPEPARLSESLPGSLAKAT